MKKLTAGQVAILVALGAIFWFSAALIARNVGSFLVESPVLAFALAWPGLWASILLTRRVASLAAPQVAGGAALATGVAALLDGIALTWFPALYGAHPFAASAWILWGAGAGLVVAVLISQREDWR
jgi:hypothetical protein